MHQYTMKKNSCDEITAFVDFTSRTVGIQFKKKKKKANETTPVTMQTTRLRNTHVDFLWKSISRRVIV